MPSLITCSLNDTPTIDLRNCISPLRIWVMKYPLAVLPMPPFLLYTCNIVSGVLSHESVAFLMAIESHLPVVGHIFCSLSFILSGRRCTLSLATLPPTYISSSLWHSIPSPHPRNVMSLWRNLHASPHKYTFRYYSTGARIAQSV
jgi:hypothetical protein